VEALRLILRYAHLIGFGLLLGGAIAQYVSGKLRINPAMLWGAVIQVVTGLALAAPWPDRDVQPPPAKLAVKLVLAILIFVMVFFSRRREQVAKGHFLGTVGMVLVTGAVATLWT
jgi:hypothetical protein